MLFMFIIWNVQCWLSALLAAGQTPGIIESMIKKRHALFSHMPLDFWEVLFAIIRKHEINEGFL